MPQFRNPFSAKLDENITFDRAFNASRILTFVYSASVLVYVVVAAALVQFVPVARMGFVGFPEATYGNLLILASAAALLILAAVLLVAPRFTSAEALLARKKIETIDKLGYELLRAHSTVVAFITTIAILGLMLFLFNGHLLHMIPFAILSILLQLYNLPRKEAWEEAKALFEKQKVMQG